MEPIDTIETQGIRIPRLGFGTFRMPANKLPENYGIDGEPLPSEIAGQLAYPFRQ